MGFSFGFLNVVSKINVLIEYASRFLEQFLFFKIHGFPFLMLFVLVCFLLSNFVFKFVSIKLFKHAFDVVRDKFTSPDDPGTITHSQAVYTEALSTLGIGSIAGVAIAISRAGPGALLWIVFFGLLSMSIKFAEVFLAHKYRIFDENGNINGGPFIYIKKGLADLGYLKIGIVLGTIYTVSVVLSSVGASTMFQANQAVLALMDDFSFLDTEYRFVSALILLVPVIFIVLFRLSKIAQLADNVIPFMTIFYFLGSLTILIVNYKNIIPSLILIWKDAFSPQAAEGGIIGSMVIGLTRAVYVTTSGGGTSSIAHAPSKTRESVREGCAAFMDVLLALLMCVLTGLVVVVTKSYKDNASCDMGIAIAKRAFVTIHPLFGKVLTISTFLFAITTIIGWSYYGSMAWIYLCGKKSVLLYRLIFLFFVSYAATTGNAASILKFCDYLWTIVMIPNLIVIFLLSKVIRKDIVFYIERWEKGLFVEQKK